MQALEFVTHSSQGNLPYFKQWSLNMSIHLFNYEINILGILKHRKWILQSVEIDTSLQMSARVSN